MTNATSILENTLSPDASTRQAAAERLETASRENYPNYMWRLSSIFGDESGPLHIRHAAGLAMKNALTSPEAARQTEYTNRWLQLDDDIKTRIKEQALMMLGSTTATAGSFASHVVAAIVVVELAQEQGLIENLLRFANKGDNVLRISTLRTFGYICQMIKPEILAHRANEMLTAVIQGARKDEPSTDVQLAAIYTLYNSLEFLRHKFESEVERNRIMQVVCEATQNPSVDVQIGAFKCLVTIMSLYYDKVGLYMDQPLVGLTVGGMKHLDERVVLQAIEFWSTVCEEVILATEAAAHRGKQPEMEPKQFSKNALPGIVPVLLLLLTKQVEGVDEDDLNVSIAASTCLSLLSKAVQDFIVPNVMSFIEAHIKSEDWRYRDAAVMAFGSILDGPDPSVLTPLVNAALPLLIGMMSDSNSHVKNTTAWTLGRICDLLIVTIKPDVLHPLVSSLVTGMLDNPRIAANCCWALMKLVDGHHEVDSEMSTGALSPLYDDIVQALLQVTESSGNANYWTAAYEAINSFISQAPMDVIRVVRTTVDKVLDRMEHLLSVQNQIVGMDWNELQSNLCSVLIAVVRKLNDDIQPFADRIMTVILQLMETAGKSSTVLEDAFLIVGSLASGLEDRFAPHIQALIPFLYRALKAHGDTRLFTVVVGVIGDIFRALGEKTSQYAGTLMPVLLDNLQSDFVNHNVKISLLSCIGDIALAIGPQFEPYLETTISVLKQAGELEPNRQDYDFVEYLGQLREGILEAYSGIVAGLKNTEKVDVLLPYIRPILELLHRCFKDEGRSDSLAKLAYGLLGDVAESFPNGEIRDSLLVVWIALILRSETRMSQETNNTMCWARDVCI